MKISRQKLRKDERGIASIIIVMLIIMILTLFVLAMARNAQREQRQSLDRQLSSQAFYASESGVNDATNYIRQHLTKLPAQKTKCDTSEIPSDAGTFPTQSLTGDNVVKYTCILYDLTPPVLEYANINNAGRNIPLQNDTGGGIKDITVAWENPAGANNIAGCPNSSTNALPNSWPANCDVGMLKIEVFQAYDIKRANLMDSAFTVFVMPTAEGSGASGEINFPAGVGDNQGAIAHARCDDADTPRCKITLKDITGISGSQIKYMRVRTLYKDSSKVSVSGVAKDSSGKVKFKNAQMIIDSTGKANDVLRRIRTNVPIIPDFNYSPYTVKTMGDMCKLLDVYPGQTAKADNCTP